MDSIITIDTLKTELGEEKFNQLANASINPANSFMSGKNTNVFKSKNDVAKKAEQYIQDLIVLITQIATEKTVEYTAKLIAEYTSNNAKLLSTLPSSIKMYSQETFEDKKLSVSDVIKQITEKPVEETTTAKVEQQSQNDEINTINKHKEKLEETKKNIQIYLAKANEATAEICQYISAGPDFIADQLDKQIKSVVTDIKQQLDESTANNRKKLDEYAKKKGEENGTLLANKYNEAINNQAYKQIKKQRKAIAKQKQQQAFFEKLASIQVEKNYGM